MAVDGVVAWFVLRPISRWITRLAWRTPVSPNQISVVALVIGVAAGPVVALGGRKASVAAAVLLVINVLLDCVDGDLARLTYRTSRLGQWLDTIGDDASLLSYLLGLGIAVTWLPFGLNPVAFAAGAGLIFAATSAYVYVVLVRQVGIIDTALFPHAGGQRSLVGYAMKRDFFTVLFLALAMGGLEWMSLGLIGAGAVTNAIAVFVSARLWSRNGTANLR
jgi:phosphatidylglycerophosphate synthase